MGFNSEFKGLNYRPLKHLKARSFETSGSTNLEKTASRPTRPEPSTKPQWKHETRKWI